VVGGAWWVQSPRCKAPVPCLGVQHQTLKHPAKAKPLRNAPRTTWALKTWVSGADRETVYREGIAASWTYR
jgi:hypothetical protein